MDAAANNGLGDKIDIILDYFDDRLIRRQFLECDEAIARIDVSQVDSSVLVSVLGITLAAKERLLKRKGFFDRVFAEIKKRKSWWYARSLLNKYK